MASHGSVGCGSELEGAAISDGVFGVSVLFRCLLPGPFLRNFPCARSASSFSSPLLALAFFLPPSFYSAFPKSQRDSRWGVVGYDLRAGCDVRRGSQRCVGRGARGAVSRHGLAWSGRAVRCREWMRMGGARRTGRRDGRAGRSLRRSRHGGQFLLLLVLLWIGQGEKPPTAVRVVGVGSGSVDHENNWGGRRGDQRQGQQPRSMAAVLCQPAVLLQTWSL